MPAPPSGAGSRRGRTVAALLEEGAARLEAAGIATARLDAELLLRQVLGWDRAAVVTRAKEPVPPAAAQRFAQAIEQRSLRRPLQHLTGVQAFWRHEFLVTPDVLIPRPETELLVETALELLRDVPRPVIVDVGTGSGCIALSLAAERADAKVHAIDISAAALRVAHANAARLALKERVTFHEGDLLQPVAGQAGRIDLVVSNPPYVFESDLAGLEPEVRDHEPRTALVPPEGVGVLYARLLRAASDVLHPGGWVTVEVGEGLATSVVAASEQAGLSAVRARPDLQGIPRVVQGRRPAS